MEPTSKRARRGASQATGAQTSLGQPGLFSFAERAYIEAQTVESTIRAYGNGKIKLPELDPKTRDDAKRYVEKSSFPHPYTKLQVATFLGWTNYNEKADKLQPNHACNVAFEMLDAFEAGIVTRKELRKVPTGKLNPLEPHRSPVKIARMRFAAIFHGGEV